MTKRNRVTLLIIAICLLEAPVMATAEDNGAVVKVGKLFADDEDKCVNITVTNTSSVFETSVGVECTALANDEPVESHGTAIVNLSSGEKGYDKICFHSLHGLGNVTPSCRVDAINKRQE